MLAQQRLYLNAEKTILVPEGDPRAAFLYATPGTEIPETAAKMFGLVDGRLPEGRKQGEKPANKQSDTDNKSGSTDNKGSQETAPALTDIKGIGNATAKKLAAGGIASVADLAQVNPEEPPAIEGIDFKKVDLAGWVGGAKALGETPATE